MKSLCDQVRYVGLKCKGTSRAPNCYRAQRHCNLVPAGAASGPKENRVGLWAVAALCEKGRERRPILRLVPSKTSGQRGGPLGAPDRDPDAAPADLRAGRPKGRRAQGPAGLGRSLELFDISGAIDRRSLGDCIA